MMIRKRVLSLAIASVLLVPALPAQAAPVIVCTGIECVEGDVFRANSVLSPEALVAWAQQRNLTGIDPHHWAAPLLVGLVDTGVIKFQSGDHVNLDAPVTLFQAAKVAMEWAKQPIENLSPRELAVKAADQGLIPGPVPTEDRPITRLEAAYLTGRMTGFTGTVEQKVDMAKVLTDWEQIPAGSRPLVYWVTLQNRLFLGYEDKSFRPNDLFTLGQFVAVQQRLINWSAEQPPVLQGG